VTFEGDKESSDGDTLIALGILFQIYRANSKVGFYPGNMQERLSGGMK